MLWQDAQNRVYLTKELDRITGQGHSAISVTDTLKIIECREQRKKLSALEMELAAARQEGFVSKQSSDMKKTPEKGPVIVIGIFTSFGRKNDRDAIRKAWMSTGAALKRMEEEKGIVPRFVIGRRYFLIVIASFIVSIYSLVSYTCTSICSANRGDSLDRSIDSENSQTNDFFILENHVEAPEELPKKTKLFFAHAADSWTADYYAKVNDNVFVNLDSLRNALASYVSVPRAYIGCMKSGEVFSEQGHKWYEPDWWKFGDGKTYFRHASTELFVISQALARYISINRALLRTYAHDDVSVGSWFIGADVKYIDDRKFCCSSWSTGAICSGV
ncbi:hydroxyproline O-galactosyltransferase HPGT1-like isoform X3 [Capsicum annuum]|uniref:hydroxyproline O-galactosyltransferase HPGT1-like isoform X3 n=1 Tax=Capsicum annuum TaxID=4072 RepID=UPI001FB104F8|nr:hydroxyproline O-galactosyltransferase HPGT1-like isoform X3 [Capsicum annuum]